MSEREEIFGPVISEYSRAQAIEDGVLVDVSETAREAGIRFPLALTRAVWESCVEVPRNRKGQPVPCQDEPGRLRRRGHDRVVLSMRPAARRLP